MKRLTEFIIAVALVAVFSPVWLIIILAIGRQPFFVQRRLGKNSRPFQMLKFRTMKIGNHEITDYQIDNRVTKVGRVLRRFHLDELPQLLNIIQGHMSFIGPRAVPEFVEGVRVFDIKGYQFRSTVKPGITGLAQIYCTKFTTLRNKFKYDAVYIRSQCLRMDFKITTTTINLMIFGVKE